MSKYDNKDKYVRSGKKHWWEGEMVYNKETGELEEHDPFAFWTVILIILFVGTLIAMSMLYSPGDPVSHTDILWK